MKKAKFDSVKILLIVLILVPFLGCGDNGDESDVGQLELKLGEATRYIIPSAAYSCLQRRIGGTDPDLQPKYVELPPLTISWTSKTHYLKILGIFIKVKSGKMSGSEYTCQFTDQELFALIPKWYTGQVARLNPGAASTDEFPAKVSTGDTGGCNIRCGGINIRDGNFTLLGELKVIAVATDSEDGSEIPLSSNETLTIRSIKL